MLNRVIESKASACTNSETTILGRKRKQAGDRWKMKKVNRAGTITDRIILLQQC